MPAIHRPSQLAPVRSKVPVAPRSAWLSTASLRPSPLSISLYGEPTGNIEGLKASIQAQGILVPLVVAAGDEPGTWEILSGHRRWACAQALSIAQIFCEIRDECSEDSRQRLILEYNRQRRKTFSQLMREADVLETILTEEARHRRLANLRHPAQATTAHVAATLNVVDGRDSDDPGLDVPGMVDTLHKPRRQGRTDTAISDHLGLGGKDLYRQARAVWRTAQTGDVRAQSSILQLDAETKTIHAAYKDLRRRTRFTADFSPTPYDVWSFRHDRAFGIPYPGSIPPAIVAHAIHYFCPPGGLVVDPMAGGGTTLDVCASMDRRCLAYDLEPARPDILRHDIQTGFPADVQECDLIFCDPPYHTMLASAYVPESISTATWSTWATFLTRLTRLSFQVLRPGGYLALLLAAQTEKDLPAGYGYLDHAFLGYTAALQAGFYPERRVSCPMSAGYLPQHVRRARVEGRMLGQVRDLIVVRRPLDTGEGNARNIPLLQLAASTQLPDV